MASDERVTPVLYCDGTLDEEVRSQIRRIIPWAEFIETAAINEQLDITLPAARFPTLRARRESYIHLRKLTDIHVFSGTWRLVLDSDLLFYRRPSEVLDWHRQPRPMHMLDVVNNYGYPLEYLSSLANAALPDRMNVGLYGLDSSSVDWSRLEHWCQRQLADFGPSYLQEQGLTAMLLAGQSVLALPEHDYVLMPDVREGRAPRAIMHHYVDYSKRSYFQYGWRVIDARIRASSGRSAFATAPTKTSASTPNQLNRDRA